MIIQGSNTPIVLEFDTSMETITDFSAVITGDRDDRILKHWKYEDVEIEENKVSLPLTQSETLDFPKGKCYIEAKWVLENGVGLADIVRSDIGERKDKYIFQGVD